MQVPNNQNLTIMTRINEYLVQLSQIATAEPIVIAHENLERIRRRRKSQRRNQRSAKLKPHIEDRQAINASARMQEVKEQRNKH